MKLYIYVYIFLKKRNFEKFVFFLFVQNQFFMSPNSLDEKFKNRRKAVRDRFKILCIAEMKWFDFGVKLACDMFISKREFSVWKMIPYLELPL